MESSERLSSYDAALLHFISENGFGHTGSISVIDGDIPFEEFARDIEAKVQSLPRFRQVAASVPFNLAYPTWEYDPNFVAANHIDHIRLGPPGTWEQLLSEVASFMSVRLRKDRPYWFARLVSGMEGNRSAVFFKVHHAVMDGVGAEAFQRVMFEEPAPSNPVVSTMPPIPGATIRLARGLRDNARTGFRIAAQIPSSTVRLIRWFMSDEAKEARRIDREFERAQGIRFPFNRPCSGKLRFQTTRFDLEDLRNIGRAWNGTVNDVLLAIVSRAVQHYAQKRNIDVAGKVLKLNVPVNMRQEGDVRNMGNIATLVRVYVPLDFDRPADFVQFISRYMRAVKQSHLPLVRHRWYAALMFIMTPVFAPFVQRSYASVKAQRKSMQPGKKIGAVMVVSNVPRRPAPLHLAGRPVTMRYPLGSTTPHIGIGCIAMTCGQFLGASFAVNGEVAAEMGLLVSLAEEAYEEFQTAAAAASSAANR